MSLNIEEVKILPSLLQEMIENQKNIFIYCHLLVSCDADEKSFKISLPSCQFKSNIPNCKKFMKDPKILKGVLTNTNKPNNMNYNTYNVILNFPIKKVVRGIHPTVLSNFDKSGSKDDLTQHLDSWISIYDTEVSTYNDGDEEGFPYSILQCNSHITKSLILIEFKRIYTNHNPNDKTTNFYDEYLYYLTFKDEYDETTMRQAFEEYHLEFNCKSIDPFMDFQYSSIEL